MKIAIIGGGVFGTVIALRLAEIGESVTIFERRDALLQGASAHANRLHQGFHYPRDDETARQCQRGYLEFRSKFEAAILKNVSNAYFIAKHGSLTSPSEYLAFCRRHGLDYEEVDPAGFAPPVTNVALGITTNEVMYDVDILRRLIIERLGRLRVTTQLKSEVTDVSRGRYSGFELTLARGSQLRFDAVINCCYAGANRLNARLGHRLEKRQYEYVAVPVIEADWHGPVSITILDGLFMCLLPLGQRGRYLLYQVEHCVIDRDDSAILDESWFDPHTSPFALTSKERWFQRQLASCCEFLPALRTASLEGILQGPRVVLADHEDTDARPSFVTQHEPGYLSVFSGKVSHCVEIADEVAARLGRRPTAGTREEDRGSSLSAG